MARRARKPGHSQAQAEDDPVLLMLDVGKQLWEQEHGDQFVARLRSEDEAPPHRSSDTIRVRDRPSEL